VESFPLLRGDLEGFKSLTDWHYTKMGFFYFATNQNSKEQYKEFDTTTRF
jgi:hypothetical protein